VLDFNVPVHRAGRLAAMHCMQRGLLTRKLPVCRSVKRVICDKTKESCAKIFIPYERTFTLVFWEEEWLVGATPSTWNFRSNWTDPIGAKSPIFSRYSLVSPQP